MTFRMTWFSQASWVPVLFLLRQFRHCRTRKRARLLWSAAAGCGPGRPNQWRSGGCTAHADVRPSGSSLVVPLHRSGTCDAPSGNRLACWLLPSRLGVARSPSGASAGSIRGSIQPGSGWDTLGLYPPPVFPKLPGARPDPSTGLAVGPTLAYRHPATRRLPHPRTMVSQHA